MRYTFDRYRLDARRRELSVGSSSIAIAPKAFAVLLYLLENRDRMVPKLELLEAFWPPSVSESAMQSTIRQVRKALGDDGRRQGLIRTYHGQGFRFIASVTLAPVLETKRFLQRAEATDPAVVEDEPLVRLLDELRPGTVLACHLRVPAADPGVQGGDDTIGSFLLRAKRRVEAQGGLVLHTMIDGFTAVFGAARGMEKGTECAVACAHELIDSQEAVRLSEVTISVGFGIEIGRFPVLSERELTIGSLPLATIRAALALAKRAAAGQVALSEAAASRSPSDLLQRLSGENLASPDHVKPALRTVALSSRGFRDFIGRDSEQAFLRAKWQLARRGRGQAVFLNGEPGIGKTRLLSEFLSETVSDRHRHILVAADPLMRNTPLSVMGTLCRRSSAITSLDLTGGWLDDDVDRSLWRDLLGDPAVDLHPVALSPQMRRRRTFRIVREVVGLLARGGPAVIAFEDIHWMDATSRDCLEWLVRNLEDLHVMIVATARPAASEAGWSGPATTSLWLHPLDRQDSIDLVWSHIGGEGISFEDAGALARRAAGNPLFLEELSLAVKGGADPNSGLPDSVQELTAVRADGFSVTARALLQAASAMGPQASADLMIRVLDWEAPLFEQALSELLAAGILVEDMTSGEPVLRFRHVLLQEAAHDMLARDARTSLHRRIIGILRTSERSPAPERLAWHYQEAGDHQAAVEQWTKAARAACRRSASRETIAFAQSGLELLKSGACSRQVASLELELLLAQAPALAARFGYGSEAAGSAYKRARGLSRSRNSPRHEFRTLVGLWNYAWVRGDLAGAREHAADLLAIAEREGDPALMLRAHASMGEILLHIADLDTARTQLGHACALFEQHADVRSSTRVPAVAGHCYAAWTASLQGRSDAAMRLVETAGVIARELVQPFSTSLYLALRAELLLLEGDVAGCLEGAREASALCDSEGFPFWHGTSLVLQGWAEAHAVNPRLGVKTLRRGIEVFTATGARIQMAKWHGLLAEALLLAEDLAAARAANDAAIAWARATGDVFFLPRIEGTAAAISARS